MQTDEYTRDLEKTTAAQAIELNKLKTELAELKKGNKEIALMITCIGGPLNDNKLNFSKEQLAIFQSILTIIDIPGDENEN